ncbi:MAG TPA: glycogen debranching enzyme [Candidatus Hungatella pullicola]|nr:glycogen debranching enzyme [Candidatus Hungatella pullicola]
MTENGIMKRGASPLLHPTGKVGGFFVRPGIFRLNGTNVVPGGVSFTIHSLYATYCELCLFHRKEQDPFAVLPFPEDCRIGKTYSMIVFDLDIDEIEYAYRMDGPHDPSRGLLFDRRKYLLDPYARAVTGQSVWGSRREPGLAYHARVVEETFDWGGFQNHQIPFHDMIIYEVHVRGFTKHPSSGVKYGGTFAGILEKLPYLLELGVNTVELMPVFEFDEMEDSREVDGKCLFNYWGYNTVCFFAPNTSYTAELEYNREGYELKNLIRILNANGIDVILDVVLNHTAEGDERGPFFSFKGLDNNVYYMLTPDGKYYNFSGVGNTLNCNHPMVRQFILDCLRHWVVEYRVDGFRFDLASILGRDEDGKPLSEPPLLESLAFDPILGHVKLIAEAWDAGGLYQVGSFPAWNRWAEWNGKYRDDIRRFLKGDEGMAQAAIARICGSLDLYPPDLRQNASVNFITCHDGFTLYDLYAYNEKHNEANGWNNTDGANDNNSWNCGAEGETEEDEVLTLRERMRKNAFTLLLCSRGAAMFLAGDEFGNTQFGNNNPYCQDNEISWLDWSRLEKYSSLFQFVSRLVAFRKEHPVLRGRTEPAQCGWPDLSVHNGKAWNSQTETYARQIGVLFAGRTKDGENDDLIFLAVNAHWESHTQELPAPPVGMEWKLVLYTASPSSFDPEGEFDGQIMNLKERSAAVFLAAEEGAVC